MPLRQDISPATRMPRAKTPLNAQHNAPLRFVITFLLQECDLLDADALAFIHVENQSHRGGRNLLHLDRNLSVRAPLFDQQFSDDQAGAVGLCLTASFLVSSISALSVSVVESRTD